MRRAARRAVLAMLSMVVVEAQAASAQERRTATAADRTRLARSRAAWEAGLAGARRSAPGEIAAQADLFDPDRVLPGAMPPAGNYRCRVTKLGARSAGMLDHVAYPWFACRVAAGRLEKLSGSQRFAGTLSPVRDDRALFLGTSRYGDEARPIPYGRDRQRDMAGWVERVGPKRWRLALPWPAFESQIDVVELVPVA